MRILIGVAALLSVSAGLAQTEGQEDEQPAPTLITIRKSEVRTLRFADRIRSVDGHNPAIIDVNPEAPNRIRLLAKEVGVTSITATDEFDKQHHYEISVEANMGRFRATLKRLYPDLNLELVELTEDALLIRGSVPDEVQRDQVIEVCETFYATVLNHLKDGGSGSSEASRIPPGMQVVAFPVAKSWSGKQTPTAVNAGDVGSEFEIRKATEDGSAVVVNVCRLFAVGSNSGERLASVVINRDDARKLLVASKNGQLALFPHADRQNDLQDQIRGLHRDVKRLIELLEERRGQQSAERSSRH